MPPPLKPFPSYKWRWATVTPSEGLNDPAVYIGVLRALGQCEGLSPSSKKLQLLLAQVEKEAGTTGLSLARSQERNLIRNSGQYWKALGLLSDARGTIQLTPLGRNLAEGKVTRAEFAALTVKSLTLPNRLIEDDVSDWEQAGLEIKPLELILRVMLKLLEMGGAQSAYLTNEELVGIVIPLAGIRADVAYHAEAVIAYRQGKLDLKGWPDCAPADNDRRMAREHLIFLEKYGFCILDGDSYHLNEDALPEITQLLAAEVVMYPETATEIPGEIKEAVGMTFVERARNLIKVVSRPGQQKFRREVLKAYGNKCLLTEENLILVLAASHIIPVEYDGSDDVGNGICLRTDIHVLFDAGHIRILPDGTIKVTEDIARSATYAALPRRIDLPRFISRECLEWRNKYY